MTKSETTLRLEDEIYKATKKIGVFGCFEVTIGWFGTERVDYLTYDTKGIWRCYEIKASVKDFHSPAAKTFIGHFNYFVMPADVFVAVQNEIPLEIGVIVEGRSIIKAKRRELGITEDVLFKSMVRSLAREYQAGRQSKDQEYLNFVHMCVKQDKQRCDDAERLFRDLRNAVIDKCGYEFYRDLQRKQREADHD